MAKVLLNRGFDFLFCKTNICVNSTCVDLGIGETKIVDIPDGTYSFRVSAMGFYYGTQTLQISGDTTIDVTPILPQWFFFITLSLICLSITLGILGLLPNIVSSSFLLILLIPMFYVSTFKRNSFFTLRIIHNKL